MRAIVLTTLSALCLAGCQSGEDAAADFQTRDEAGTTTSSVKVEGGEATMQTGKSVPVDLPAGFALYPGAQVLSNTVVEQPSESGAIVTMSSADVPQKLVDFYREKASAAEVEITMDLATRGGKIIGGEGPGGLTFSFSAQPSKDGSIGQLTIGAARRAGEAPEAK